MSKYELLANIELLNKYEDMMEEIKAEADRVRNSIKAEMEAREVEELIAGQYTLILVFWKKSLVYNWNTMFTRKAIVC